MCGRFTREFTWAEVRDFLDLRWPGMIEVAPSYNVAPTQVTPAARGGDGGNELAMLRFGFAAARADGAMLINARAETLREKPTFRGLLATGRCVVPASGFYEWTRDGSGQAQPHYIFPADGGVLAFAGLWRAEVAEGGDGTDGGGSAGGGSFVIVTTAPNSVMSRLHDRMPAILTRASALAWLDPATSAGAVVALLRPCEDGVLRSHPVSPRVNRAGPEGRGLIAPVVAERGLFER